MSTGEKSEGRGVLGYLFFVILVVGVALSIPQIRNFVQPKPYAKYFKAWTDDVEILRSKNKLPEQFNDVKEVKISTQNEALRKYYENSPVIHTKPDGAHILEIFLGELEQGGLVVQYDLVNISSGNTIWEYARTFAH